MPEYTDPQGFWWYRRPGGSYWSPFFDPKEGRPGFPFLGRGAHWGHAQARRAAERARRAENRYAVELRHLARPIGQIIGGMFEADPNRWYLIAQALENYSAIVEPWARRVAERMLAEVARRDARSWHEHGQIISMGLQREVANAPIGEPFQQMLASQVDLIKSLFTREANEVHSLAQEAMVAGTRWEALVPEIKDKLLDAPTRVKGNANTIARTETSRAHTTFTRARAEYTGSEGYIWRTARDRDVRPLHKKLEGTYHRWDENGGEGPIAGERGEFAHPGCIYNCRCFPEVVLPGADITQRLGPLPRNPAYLAALRAQGVTEGTAFE